MTRGTQGVDRTRDMRAALPAVVLLFVALAGCCHRRCLPVTSPPQQRDPATVRFLRAHAAALKKARLAWASPAPGLPQEERVYEVADLRKAAPRFWKALPSYICDESMLDGFGPEECRRARSDWRWTLVTLLHLHPGLVRGDHDYQVTLQGPEALRVRAEADAHEGLSVYFSTVRDRLSRTGRVAIPTTTADNAKGSYEVAKALILEELAEAWDETWRAFIAQTHFSIILRANGTWTASSLSPWSSAMSGKPAKPKRSRGLWSASERQITFMPLRAARDGVPSSPLEYDEFTGLIDRPGLIRIYKNSPDEYPEEYGWPLRKK
jgi:hypothetical protein